MSRKKTHRLISASACIASAIFLFVTLYPSRAWAWEVVYSAASDLLHQIGRVDVDGWSASTGQDPQNRYLCFGPYTTLIPGGANTASFRMMIDNNTFDNLPVVSLDIYDATYGQILALRTVQRQEFSGTFSYQNFDLNFTSIAGHQLEFRTWWFGVSYIREINVRISGPDAPFAQGYQGCFTDDTSRALPSFFGEHHTVDSCKLTVRNAGLNYAGLQFFGQCWGGNLLRYNHVSDAECNTRCDANPSQFCGGAWRNSIYATSASGVGPRSLSDNRNRLFATLAQIKGTSTCSLWSRLNESERYTFLIQTKVLSHSDSYVWPPDRRVTLSDGTDCSSGCTIICDGYSTFCYPQCGGYGQPAQVSPEQCLCNHDCTATYTQTNLETLLDHATTLFTINPPHGCSGDGPGPSEDLDRIYVGFDDVGKWAVRNYSIAGGHWVLSDDCAGPHPPFNAREDIDWGSAISICPPFFQHNGPTRHHYSSDSLFAQVMRMGVSCVTDRSITEVTTSYDWLHHSDPRCIYGGIHGYEKVENRMGPAEYGWMPDGCGYTPPASGTSFAGVGPSCGPPPSCPCGGDFPTCDTCPPDHD